MSIKVSTWVWENGPEKPAEKLLLLALADHANDDGMCFPSQPRLCEMVGCSPRYLRELRDSLVDSGYISVVERGYGTRSSVYRVHYKTWMPSNHVECGTIPQSESDAIVPNPSSECGTIEHECGTIAQGSGTIAPHIRQDSAPEPSLTVIEPSRTLVDDETSSRKVDELWEAMVEVFGEPATQSERGRINRALKELRQAKATPEEILSRSAEARKRWGAKFAPQTLASRWGDLSTSVRQPTDLKGNAQLGKDHLPFSYKDDKDLVKQLGSTVFVGGVVQ